MGHPKFMVMEGSRSIGYEFWVSVIIRNVRNGISRVEQRTKNGWYALFLTNQCLKCPVTCESDMHVPSTKCTHYAS